MKARKLYVVHQPARKHIPGKRLSLLASVLTIGASIGIGVTFNPERSWAGNCAGVYSSKAGAGSTSILGYFNSITNSYVDVVTYPGGNNINALATQPSTGNLFFVNRATGKVVTYNVNTGVLTTLSGTVPTNPTIIGATFNSSGKLYIYYTNATLVEVNPATGSQTGSTITISGIPGNAGTTNGDIAIGSNGTLYALGDTSATTSQLYSITITGATTATATAVNGSNNISGVNAANGLAIDPATGKFYISASTGTYELNLTTKVATQLTATAGVNDLSACASSTPDLPTITKAFSPTSVSGTPATSALTLTLGNTNTVPLYSLQTLTDTLPSGLTVSSPNGLGGTCTAIAGNTVTATAGSNTISLNSGFNIPAGGCTVTVNVTTNSAGTYVNNIPVGGLKTFAGDNATAASSTLTVTIPPVTVSGTVFSDADADVTINGSDAGTNAGSGSLTIYAVDGTGKVMDKATVGAAGTYSLTNVTANTSVTLRLSNDSSVAVGATAPTTATIPSAPITWYFTGENKNGTVDGTIATLGNIALTTTTANVTNQNFGIRQPYTIAQDAAPNTCNPDYRTALNTGITAAGGQVTAGNYDLNWTAEWIAGPASGTGTPYATPRPVGPMPAVVVGNLASGAWVNAPSNANWISYPFRLSPNGDGNHKDSDLDGRNGEDGSGVAIVGTSDDVRLKFTALLTLPSNATTTSISLPIGAAMDNQFISIKVNGVENLSPIPTSNPQANGYAALQMVNITNGWQTGVNTIEVTLDSGPPLAGFLLAVQATTTQVCATPVTVSGTVFDDADGSKLQNGAEVGSNGGGLNAVLVDSTNKVVATTAVAANGTYSFSNVPSNATYTVRITTATATVGSAPPAVALPSGWVSTGENLNGTADGTVDGILSVPVTTTNVTTANLGIERQPTAVGGTASSQANPGGTTTVAVASTLFTGSTDPDGTVASYKITAFPSNTTSITINGTNYTSGSFPGAGVTVTTAQLAGMVVDPIDGTVSVGIPFQALDNAGQPSSNTATASLPFTAPAVCSKSAADGSYATSGTNKNSIWWLNFECYDETIASTATGQPFTFTLPDGSTMTLNVKKTGANPLKTITSPSWGLAAFGNSGQYGGVTGKPIFYNTASVANQDWKETLTSITVTDKLGNVRSYSFVTADGETTNPTTDGFGRTASEQLNFATNGTGWTQVELLNMPGQSGPLGTTLTGAGSSNASWTGTTGSNNGGVILSTNNPTQVSIASTLVGTAGSYTSLQGGLFGIGMPKLTLIKNINGRIAAADQFTTEIAYTAPAVSLKTATSSGAATTFSTGAIAVLPGNVINLRETMAAGSSSPLTAYNASIACTNVNPTATVLPSGAGTSFNITPRIGDDITCTITNSLLSISGTVFSDADADVTINGTDAGTNAGSSNLTIYAVDGTGNVVDKATVGAAGAYSLTKVPSNTSVTLRLSNDSSVAVGGTAPTTSTIPSGWYYTGENKNGTVDGTIATLGNIALTTTTVNVTNQNFGIRQPYTIAPDTAPTTCNPDYRTALNTGITAAGGQVATGAYDLNWTAEWLAGPASGPGTPYAPPRPVGVMPAVVTGNLAPGAWVNEPANARWISYPFRLPNNGNGVHNDADLDGITGEGNSGFSGPGSSDDVRLKFTAQLTLPSNANTLAISLPVGVAIDNQFVSIKVNGVENLVPTPAANPIAADYGTTKTVNITNGWQAGVNTIEVIADSGPDRVGFFLGVQATTTQVCSVPNVLLVKRITAINGNRTNNPNDNTPLNAFVDDTTSTRQADDNSPNWPTNYLLGAIDAGKVNPGDEIEYTVYFLNAGSINANTVRICDRLSANQDFKLNSYGASKDLQLQLGTSTVLDLTSANDAADRAQLISAGGAVPANCYLKAVNDNGTLMLDITGTTGVPALTTMPGSTGKGTPNNSYGFFRFVTKVKP